jgi:Alginate export
MPASSSDRSAVPTSPVSTCSGPQPRAASDAPRLPMKISTPLRRRALAACFGIAAIVHGAAAQTAAAEGEVPTITLGIDMGAQAAIELDAFWGLAQTFAPAAGYRDSISWVEGYAKPYLKAQRELGGSGTLYGGASLIATGTWREDVFQQGDTGRLLVEDAYLGWRGALANGWNYDLSAGAQRYELGRGLLLAVGAGNGFERGAAALAPRRAWQMTGVARVAANGWTTEAFYLDPNELASGDTGTRLAGGRVEWSAGKSSALGLAYFEVLASEAPYPKAPVEIIDGGRDGLGTTGLYWRYEPEAGALAGLSFSGEAAWQSNGAIGMTGRGIGVEIAYRFAQSPFTPRLSYSPRYFSGDDPRTADRLERFDPLFYDGGPATWSSGGNGSFAFYNSNLVVQRLRLDLVLSPRDFVNLNYWYVRAAQVDSPVQYGQAGRVLVTDTGTLLVSGFPKAALSQEFYAEHTHALSANAFLTWGVAGAFPQEGVKAVVTTGAKDWWAALVNLSLRY